MGIYRSTNPTEFDDVDGIIINESAPFPNISGVAANIAILVGQCQRGPAGLTEVGSIGEFHEVYGKSLTHKANIAMKNKKFGRLRICRVIAADGVVASKAFASSATDRITFYAKQGKGAYGNGITVTIASGTTSGKKYTIHDGNTYAVLPDEVYDNIEIAAIDSSTFAASKLITVTVDSSAAEPTNASATALASGVDGTVGDTDYQTAIAHAEVEQAGNILFLDEYSATRNGYLRTHVANTQDKMVIVAGAEADASSDNITDAALNRDANGFIIYAANWVQTNIDGVLTYTSPASWLAAVISQTSPHVDPAYAKNVQYTSGVTGLKNSWSRSTYINLKNAGVCAWEYDADLGFKVKSGVVTQISDSSKVTILRRRMANYLTESVALYLKNYQNAPNTRANRDAVNAAISSFVAIQESNGILPKDSEVASGHAKQIDTESLNTDTTLGLGFFKILWKQRIYSSMRYIVLQAEIGETVTVTEA